MTVLLSVCVGILFATGIFMILRRGMVKLVIGLALLGHAANLLVYTASRPARVSPALVEHGKILPPDPHADPLPAAIILTAIVISFGIVSYAIVLTKQAYQATQTDDLDELTSTDLPE